MDWTFLRRNLKLLYVDSLRCSAHGTAAATVPCEAVASLMRSSNRNASQTNYRLRMESRTVSAVSGLVNAV